MAPVTAESLVETLELAPHPEGGFYKEVYRSEDTLAKEHLPAAYDGPRSMATHIYYLVTGSSFSALHRIRQDELWHYYCGTSNETLVVHVIDDDGKYTAMKLGLNFAAGERPHFTVKGGSWFGSCLEKRDAPAATAGDSSTSTSSSNSDATPFVLAGCTVAPGFDFADFELPTRAHLLSLFPHLESVIVSLTR